MTDHLVTIERETFARLILAEMAARHGGSQDAKATADARPDFDGYEVGDDIKCGAYGPGGECARLFGHVDDTEGHFNRYGTDHWSWDSDHFEHWPAGWLPDEVLLEEANARIAVLEAELEAARAVQASIRG